MASPFPAEPASAGLCQHQPAIGDYTRLSVIASRCQPLYGSGMSDVPRTRRGNLESWISSEPNPRGYYEAKVWMGTKASGQPDRRHVQRKTLAAVRKRGRELERMRDTGMAGRPGEAPTAEEK